MPEYRYWTTASKPYIESGVLAELPLYGVWMQRVLSGAGQFTGTFKLDTGIYNDEVLLQGTNPGQTTLYIERDGTIIWGGYIWSRTWSEQSKTMQLNGSTFESAISRVAISSEDFVFEDADQVEILQEAFARMNVQFATDWDMSDEFEPPCGVTRTIMLPAYEFHFVNEVVDQLVGVDNGLDYTIVVKPDVFPGVPKKVVRIGYPQLGTNYPKAVYDYPGSVSDFYWPESASDGCIRKISIGAGAGEAMLSSIVVDSNLINGIPAPGYPQWDRVDTYKNISDQQTLDDKTIADYQKYRISRSVPSFTIKPDIPGGFDAWDNLGASFGLHIESVRFPGGKDIDSRMIGWELSVGDSDSDETLKITMEDDGGASEA